MNKKYLMSILSVLASNILLLSPTSFASIEFSNNNLTIAAHLNDDDAEDNIHEYIGFQLRQSEHEFEPTVIVFAENNSATFTCEATASSIGEVNYQILESFALNMGRLGVLNVSNSNGLCDDIIATNLFKVPNPGSLRDYAPFDENNFNGPQRAVEIPQQETFESYPISWHSPNAHFFTPWSGQTPSYNTGPSGALSGMFFGLFETSMSAQKFHTSENYSGAFYQGNFATLESGFLAGGSQSLNFDYFMYGIDVGTLSVDVMDGNGVWQNGIWQRIGQQQTAMTNSWFPATVNVSGAIKVRLRAEAKGNYKGDIAIDNLNIQ